MADIKGIEVQATTYGIEDTAARAAAETAETAADTAAAAVSTLQENLESDIMAVIKPFLTTRTVLWTNNNKNAQFAQQEITIANLSSYDAVEIVINRFQAQSDMGQIIKIKLVAGQNDIVSVGGTQDAFPSGYYTVALRNFNVSPSDNRITVQDANLIEGGTGGAFTVSTNNSYFIPMQIIGIKYGANPPA